MVKTWKRLAYSSSSSGDFNTGEFTSSEEMRIIVRIENSGSIQPEIVLGTDGSLDNGTNYQTKGAYNGTEFNRTGQDSIESESNTSSMVYGVFNITNISDKEKTVIGQWTYSEGANTTSAPTIIEVFGKYANSTDSVNIIGIKDSGAGSFGAGEITVFGEADSTISDEKTTLTNIEAGTQYRETDTRKIYRRKAGATVDYTAPYDDSNSWTQENSWWSIDTTNEEADFTNGGTNASHRVYTTMDITLDNSQWICDFTFNAGNSLRTSRMVCLTNDTAYPTGGTNGIEFHIDTSGTTHIKSGGSLSSNAYTTSTNSTYYIRLMRTSSTNARLQVFSDSARTTQLGSTIDLSVSSSLTGIQYLQHASHTSGGSSSGGNWSISNLKIYNNKTVSELDASWVERGSA